MLYRGGRLDQRRICFGRLAGRHGQVPTMDESLIGEAPEGNPTRELAPRSNEESVEQRVVRPYLLGVIGEACEGIRVMFERDGGYRFRASKFGDGNYSADSTDQVGRQGQYIELITRSGQCMLVVADGAEQSSHPVGGGEIEGARVDQFGCDGGVDGGILSSVPHYQRQ